MPKNRSVFLVSGRDHRARDALSAVLLDFGLDVVAWEAAMALTEHAAPHAQQVLQAAFAHCSATVVLFTGDDEARLRRELAERFEATTEGRLAPQPRPNVLFEAGIATALHPRSTVLVQVGRLRTISDLAGVQFVVLDESLESAQSLVRRLRTAGCPAREPKPTPELLQRLACFAAEVPPVIPAAGASIAVLRALKSLFPVPRMGGGLELATRLAIGSPLVLSARIAAEWESPRWMHWPPGATEPLPLPLNAARQTQLDWQLVLEMPGPAGVHHFDLYSSAPASSPGDGAACIARTSCTAYEP